MVIDIFTAIRMWKPIQGNFWFELGNFLEHILCKDNVRGNKDARYWRKTTIYIDQGPFINKSCLKIYSCCAKSSLDSFFKYKISNASDLTLFLNVVMPSVFISLILAWAKADSAKVSTSSELPMILMELITASENKFYLAK